MPGDMVTLMKTTIEIPDPLFESAKAAAAREGIPLKALIERGLRSVLEESDEAGSFKLRDASVTGKGLHPDAKAMSWDEIRDRSYGKSGS